MSASNRSNVRPGMKSSNAWPAACSRCHASTSGNGHVGCSTMSGLRSRNAQYQSAYSCTGANAGTVAMLACTNRPYRHSSNHRPLTAADVTPGTAHATRSIATRTSTLRSGGPWNTPLSGATSP